jgi:hypothetical protein
LNIFVGEFTSYYSKKRPEYFAKDAYHKIHVLQLAWLYAVTGKTQFKKTAQDFLELHISDFKINEALSFSKIKNIEVNDCINCAEYGSTHLFDDRWSWGHFWSAYKNPEVIIRLHEKRQIKNIILFGLNMHSVLMGMTFYNASNKTQILQISQSTTADNVGFIKTGNYETYIRKITLPNKLYSQELKIAFHGANRNNVLALREIQVVFDMEEEIAEIVSWIHEKVNK